MRNDSSDTKRGPRTTQGKLRSSMNAVKHGRYARSFYVLRHEDKAEFEHLVEKIARRIQPQDDFEYHLVRQLAAVEWRLQRVLLVDTTILDREFTVKESAFGQAGIASDPAASLGAATHALLENSKLPYFLATRESQLIYARSAILQTLRQLRKTPSLSAPCPQIIDPMDLRPDNSFQNEFETNSPVPDPEADDPAEEAA
jgi:hypothetical protein